MNTIFNQNYAQKLFIAFKMAYSCCFGLRGNINFPDFLQNFFITSTTGTKIRQYLELNDLPIDSW